MTLNDGTTASAMTLTKTYFFKEAMRFRKIMCDKRNAIETIQRALGGLFMVYLNVKASELDDDVQNHFGSVMEEWGRRCALMILHGHPLEATTDQFFTGD